MVLVGGYTAPYLMLRYSLSYSEEEKIGSGDIVPMFVQHECLVRVIRYFLGNRPFYRPFNGQTALAEPNAPCLIFFYRPLYTPLSGLKNSISV